MAKDDFVGMVLEDMRSSAAPSVEFVRAAVLDLRDEAVYAAKVRMQDAAVQWVKENVNGDVSRELDCALDDDDLVMELSEACRAEKP